MTQPGSFQEGLLQTGDLSDGPAPQGFSIKLGGRLETLGVSPLKEPRDTLRNKLFRSAEFGSVSRCRSRPAKNVNRTELLCHTQTQYLFRMSVLMSVSLLSPFSFNKED